jgi:septin family protein
MPSSAQVVRAKFKRFQILVVGSANAGKATLLRKVYNATGKSEIFDGKGNKVDPLSTQHRHYLLINHDEINANVLKPSVDVCTYALAFSTNS